MLSLIIIKSGSYLAVHFLVNSFLPLVDGSYMFCHMALQDKVRQIMRSLNIKVVISQLAKILQTKKNGLLFTFLENILLQ